MRPAEYFEPIGGDCSVGVALSAELASYLSPRRDPHRYKGSRATCDETTAETAPCLDPRAEISRGDAAGAVRRCAIGRRPLQGGGSAPPAKSNVVALNGEVLPPARIRGVFDDIVDAFDRFMDRKIDPDTIAIKQRLSIVTLVLGRLGVTIEQLNKHFRGTE